MRWLLWSLSLLLSAAIAFAPSPTASDGAYSVEEVSLSSGGAVLAGTLTRPLSGGPHPAVVLIAGTGPRDRDNSEPGVPLKPFRLIADVLTREGVAVLRYDKRGVGESTGDFTTATLADFASDATAALGYLRSREDIDSDRIGVLAHSEGGLIATMIGAHNERLGFIILLAAPGVNGYDLLVQQTRRRMELSGASTEEVEGEIAFVQALAAAVDDPEVIERVIYQHTLQRLRTLPENQLDGFGDLERYARTVARRAAEEYSAGWFESLIEYDPASDWRAVSAPVLALFGGLDVQVDAETNVRALEAALSAGNSEDYEIVVLPKANHLFQEAETGSFGEYSILPAKFTPDLVPIILDWLRAQGIR